MSTCKRMWTDREIRSMADESAKIRIEAGQTENAKPIYYHGLQLYTPSTSIFYCHILNNDETPLSSIDDFVTWIRSYTEEVIVQGSGSITIEGTTYTLVGLYKPNESTNINVVYVTSSGYSITQVTLSNFFSNFKDAPNKIN